MRGTSLCLGLLLFLAVVSPIAHSEAATTWEPGMYWTYDTTLTWGQTETTQMTLVVAHADAFPALGPWVVVGIFDDRTGIQLVSAAVTVVPPAALCPMAGGRHSAAGVPARVLDTLHRRLDSARAGGVRESACSDRDSVSRSKPRIPGRRSLSRLAGSGS